MSNALKAAKVLSDISLIWPTYTRPRWWQWRKRSYLRYLEKHGLKYNLVEWKR